MDELPNRHYRPRRWTAMCGAALAAALFTPLPATADVIDQVRPPPAAHTSTTQPAPRSEAMAQSLISTGMIGIGLAMGGLVIVAHRRRQW